MSLSLCRVLSLLQQEQLRLSVQQVIVQRCCETLPLWDSRAMTVSQGQPRIAGFNGGAFCPASIASIFQQHAQECAPSLDLSDLATISDPSSESEVSVDDSSAISTNLSTSPSSPSLSAPSSFLLTLSALSFLKSRSPLVAALACLSASRGGVIQRTSSGWSGLPSYFRGSGRKEAILDGDQISREGEALLKNFPILRMYLRSMAEPVLGVSLEEEGLGLALCGKPVVGMLFSGLQGNVAQAMAAEAFQQSLNVGDLNRALELLELYAQPCSQEGALRDKLLACTALQGKIPLRFTVPETESGIKCDKNTSDTACTISKQKLTSLFYSGFCDILMACNCKLSLFFLSALSVTTLT